jgi:hypothetical protein
LSRIQFSSVVERIQVVSRMGSWRIRTGGSGPAGAAGIDGGIDSPNGTILHAVKLTQAAYDALTPPDPYTVYFIVD